MSEPTADDFSFGDMVTAEIYGKEVEGEVTACGPDNPDLDDDQYIISTSSTSRYEHDDIRMQEIIHESDAVSARRP